MTPPPPDAPDIEALIQGIRNDIAAAARDFPEPDPAATEPENNLHASIRLLNQRYPVALPPTGGIKGTLAHRLYALLAAPFDSITAFHAATTHALNKILKLLEGEHDDLSGEILQKTRNRMDLLEEINQRLIRVEQQLERLQPPPPEPPSS